MLEGYPVDVTAKATVSAAELYQGSLSLFEAAGFEVVSRLSARPAVVRLACDDRAGPGPGPPRRGA
ncbi:hypothetical protein CLE01_32840 [Cryobacterium levicorallinum]|nr:hypothetical protein CLE01_32840 [Cryobacterium levicorallinum]